MLFFIQINVFGEIKANRNKLVQGEQTKKVNERLLVNIDEIFYETDGA
jgi:hypothetical protein